jgi:hypothetical protein
MRTIRQAAGLLGMALTVTVFVTACHSSGTSASGSPTAEGGSPTAGVSPSPSPASVAGLAACKTSSLKLSVDNSQADGAAGSTYYPVDFTNTSAAECALTGYPGVSFVSAANGTGRQIGAAAQRDPQFDSVVVRLDPGGHAHAWLQVAEAGNYPASTCQPVTAHGLRVYPPDETAASYVTQEFNACASTSATVLTILPMRAGVATRGSTP